MCPGPTQQLWNSWHPGSGKGGGKANLFEIPNQLSPIQPQQVPPKSRPAQPPQMPPAAPPQVAQPQQPRGEVLTEPLVMSTLFVRGWRRGGAFTPEIRRARDDLTRMCADYICGHCGRRGVGCQEGSNSYWLKARCVCGRTMLKRRLAGI